MHRTLAVIPPTAVNVPSVTLPDNSNPAPITPMQAGERKKVWGRKNELAYYLR
nr:hypothetical protein [Nostoc sp. DedQUE08]